jgi:uncharacterized protein YukE
LGALKSSGGPTNLNDNAKQYRDNSNTAKELQDRIARTESSIKSKIDSGAKQDGKEITRLTENLENLKKKFEELDLITGKADYTKAVEEYETTIKNLEQELKDTSDEIE